MTWEDLRSVPLLAPLPDVRLTQLWDRSVPRRYRVGDVLRTAGDPAGHLLLLLRGRVAASGTTSAGQVVRFGQWEGPCALDKVALLDGRGHTATLSALGTCTVRALPRELFLEIIGDTGVVRTHVLQVLAKQARAQQERLVATVSLPAEARLAALLLVGDGFAGTQQELGEALGVTRVTVNRALARLREEGLVRVRGGRVDVVAPELLALRGVPGHSGAG